MISGLLPISGLARKPRSDKGKRRNSTLDAWYDRFVSMDAIQRTGALEVLRALDREITRRESGAPAEQEAAEPEEQEQPE